MFEVNVKKHDRRQEEGVPHLTQTSGNYPLHRSSKITASHCNLSLSSSLREGSTFLASLSLVLQEVTENSFIHWSSDSAFYTMNLCMLDF